MQGEVDVDEFKRLFTIEYSLNEDFKEKEEDIIFNFYGMLEDIKREKKVPPSHFNPYTGQMVIADFSLSDILKVMT